MIVHDMIPWLLPNYLSNWRRRFYAKKVEKALRAASLLVPISESTERDLLVFGIPNTKMLQVYPDVAPRYREPIEREVKESVLERYGLEPGYIFHGGGLEIRKNTTGVLRAYARLVERETKTELFTGSVPPLVIYGKIFSPSNPLATNVTGLIQELGIEKRVKLLGFVPEEDLPALYAGALFFVYPSVYEGFGLPLLEALTVGTPSLAANTSSLPEIGGAAVLYCDPKDNDSIEGGMLRLLTDKGLRSQLREAGKGRADLFSWTIFTRTVLSTFQ